MWKEKKKKRKKKKEREANFIRSLIVARPLFLFLKLILIFESFPNLCQSINYSEGIE